MMNQRHDSQDESTAILDRAIEATRRFTKTSGVPPDLLDRAKQLAAHSFPEFRNSGGVSACRHVWPSWLPQLALSLAVFATVGILVTGLFNHRSVAFADVLEAINKIKAVRFAVCIKGLNGLGEEQSGIWYESDTGVSRTEYPDTVFLLDARLGRMMMLRAREQVAVFSPITADTNRPMSGGLMEACRRDIAAARLGGRERIDGIDTEILSVTKESTTDTYWINPSTRLPVRIQTRQTVMGRDVIVLADRFEWNVEIDPAQIEFQTPAGYRSIEVNEGEGVVFDKTGQPLRTETVFEQPARHQLPGDANAGNE